MLRNSSAAADNHAPLNTHAWWIPVLSKMKRCEEKIRYRTAAGASWALWNIWWDRDARGRRRRRGVYACPHCAGWHLTSQPKRRGYYLAR